MGREGEGDGRERMEDNRKNKGDEERERKGGWVK